MQAPSHDDTDDLCKLYDKLNLTGRIIRVGQYAVFGGCAYIWEAKLIPLRRSGKTQDEEGEKVAVKVIREVGSSSSEASLRRRLIREVRAWSALHHRNVLPLYGFTYGFSPGSRLASLVSPWMPNGTARKYLERRSVSERIRVLTSVADGLCYLHRHDVVHGDLKGDNIMIDENYEPRIADFGLSKLLDEVTNTLTVTFTGNPFGSVRWIAPELISSPGITYESDIWSFGMTMLELLTNAPPYNHLKRDAQVILAVHNKELPTRPSPRFGMDDELWGICCDCWKTDPRLRPSSRVIAKRLWDLDLKCKLMARKKRRAPPSPDRRRDEHSEEVDENTTHNRKDEGDGRVRKSPKLSTLAELAGGSLPSPSGTAIPIQQSLAHRSMTPRTPRTPTSRSASGSHARAPSMSSTSSRSRRSSRGDLPNEIDPRRLLPTNVRSEGDLFSSLHHHLLPIRRTQTEPTGLDLFLGDQMPETHTVDTSSLAVSTPRRNIHNGFGTPDYHDMYAVPSNEYHATPDGFTASAVGYATPPVGYATPPAGYATPPMGYIAPSAAYASSSAYGTPPIFMTPPTTHTPLRPQCDMCQHQQQPLLFNGANDLELLQQSRYLGGFDADMVHPSQWTSSYPPTHAAFLNSFPQQNGNGSLLFDGGFGTNGPLHSQESPFLLPAPNEGDSFGSSYSSHSPAFSDGGAPSPHMLGQLFSENFQFEEPQATHTHTSPLLPNQQLYNSPQPLYQDFPQQQYQQHIPLAPSSGTVDFESLQRGIVSPALSDVSAPDSYQTPTPAWENTPLIGGFEDAFAFDSEDDGAELDGSLALFGGLDVSSTFSGANTGHEASGGAAHGGEEGSDGGQTPHGSPQRLDFAEPLGRNQSPQQPAGQEHALGIQMPPTPRLSPFLSSFDYTGS